MAVVVQVRVVPRARSNTLTRDPSGSLKARLTAPPVEGAANRALLELLARELDVSRADLEIVHGTRGRDKRVAVHGHSAADVERRLQALARADVDNAKRRS